MTSYTKEFKTKIMNESIEVGNVGIVSKKYNIPNSTIHTWFKKNDNKSKLDKSRELKKLKEQLYESKIENEILRELLKKTHEVWK